MSAHSPSTGSTTATGTPALLAYILAGGASTRFGSDKARALVDGRPMIVRLADLLAPCTSSITVVAQRPDQYQDLGLCTIADDEPGLGPIGGLQRALRHAAARGPGWIFVISADFIAFKPHWIAHLLGATTGIGGAAGEHATAVVFGGEHLQALCALYHTAMLVAVDESIAAGERGLYQLLGRAPARVLPLPGDWPALAHVNTREELARATLSAE